MAGPTETPVLFEAATIKYHKRLDWECAVQSHGRCPYCQLVGTIRKDSDRWTCYYCSHIFPVMEIESIFNCPEAFRTIKTVINIPGDG